MEYNIIGGTSKTAIDLSLFDIVGIIELPEFHDDHFLRHGILAKEIETGLYVQFRPGNSFPHDLDQQAVKSELDHQERMK